MNILQLLPKLNVGGVEKGTVEVARHLTLNGHKAVIVSGGGTYLRDLTAIGARHYTLPIGRKNPLIMVYCYLRLKSIICKENIDIVHARSRIPALIGYFAAKATDRTFITTAHGQYKKHLISRVMGWGKIVITANETMARYMKENFDVSLQKIRVVSRGVDLKRFLFKAPAESPGKVFRVGMICRFSPLKGHLDFLKAISYVSRKKYSIEVILMGDKSSAKEEYMKKIKMTVRRLMLENIVEIKDSNEDVAEVMKNLNLFVSANRQQEAFGRSVIEAQASGVPVVATKVGGVLENVIHKETGLLCEPMNPRDMADKIIRYIEDMPLRQKIAARARQHVEGNYSLLKTMGKTLEIYAEALNIKNILVFKISSFGDIILAVPSLRAIRKRFKRSNIKVLVDVRFREILDNCPYIDEVITCDFKYRDKGFGFFKLARELKLKDFDISIDFQNNHRSHFLAFLSSISERYGYDNKKWSFFLNRKIGLPVKPLSPIKHQAHLLELFGVTMVEDKLELWSGEEADEWAEKFLSDSWLKKDQKLVAISLSASRKWKTKNWGISNMVKLTDMLAKEQGIRVVVLGTGEDRPDAIEFLRKTGAKPIDAVEKTSISQLISIMKRCDVLVAGDSAPIHIAAASGTPFVAIFGPTDYRRHLPPAKKKKVLYKQMKCAPCYKPECSKRLKCMTSIKPEEVFDAVVESLKSKIKN